MAKKTTSFAKRKLNHRRRRRKKDGEILRIKEKECSVSVEADRESGFGGGEEDERCRKCMEEVEKVMMELYEKGEFGFGSFWGRGRKGEDSGCSLVSGIDWRDLNQIGGVADGNGDGHFVRYQVIQMHASLTKT